MNICTREGDPSRVLERQVLHSPTISFPCQVAATVLGPTRMRYNGANRPKNCAPWVSTTLNSPRAVSTSQFGNCSQIRTAQLRRACVTIVCCVWRGVAEKGGRNARKLEGHWQDTVSSGSREDVSRPLRPITFPSRRCFIVFVRSPRRNPVGALKRQW